MQFFAKCKTCLQENSRYVDPGIFVYKGVNQPQTSVPSPSLENAPVVPENAPVVPEIEPRVPEMAPVFPDIAPVLEVQPAPLILSCATGQSKKRTLSLEEYRESREASNYVNIWARKRYMSVWHGCATPWTGWAGIGSCMVNKKPTAVAW